MGWFCVTTVTPFAKGDTRGGGKKSSAGFYRHSRHSRHNRHRAALGKRWCKRVFYCSAIATIISVACVLSSDAGPDTGDVRRIRFPSSALPFCFTVAVTYVGIDIRRARSLRCWFH
jgi:hypothetical protein